MQSGLDIKTLARALGGEVSGGQVLAPGPGHSAADRSLSVKLDSSAPDGFVVHSFSTDDPIDCRDYVRQKIGLPPFKPNGRNSSSTAAAAQPRNDKPKSRIVAKYNYTDADGKLLYQVLRYEPKDFRQRQPDVFGEGWIWKLDDRRVLYRLPELLKFPDATIFITEGEKDADRVAGLGHCATTVAAGKWTDECVEALAGRDCIILRDNDDKGREKALEAAERLHGTAKSIRVVALPNLPIRGDVSDWLDADPRRAATLADVCFDVPEWRPTGTPAEDWPDDGASSTSGEPDQTMIRAPSREPTVFPLLSFENIRIDTQRRDYLVKHLLASTGLTVIWGPPKCGKSFWAADLGLHIALGWKYHGRRVQQATVVYIALEGRHGFPARIEAFRQHHGIEAAPFYLLTTTLNLIADATALVASIKAQLGDQHPGVVFIDTLNRSLVGSESKDEDMGKYLTAADKVAEELKCAVAIVHHCGIDASRPRGHTSLSGSVESQLAVKRGGTGQVIVTVELAKDFPEGAEINSRLEPIDVGTDPDGDTITSLVVLPADPSAKAPASRKVIGAKKVALDILRKAIDEAPSKPPASNHIPPNSGTTLIETWRTYAYQGTITESDKRDTRKRAFARAAEKLQAANLIGIWGDYVWMI